MKIANRPRKWRSGSLSATRINHGWFDCQIPRSANSARFRSNDFCVLSGWSKSNVRQWHCGHVEGHAAARSRERWRRRRRRQLDLASLERELTGSSLRERGREKRTCRERFRALSRFLRRWTWRFCKRAHGERETYLASPDNTGTLTRRRWATSNRVNDTRTRSSMPRAFVNAL